MANFSYPEYDSNASADCNIASYIRFMIAAELEACDQYERVIASTSLPYVRTTIQEILDDEKTHIGSLLSLLYTTSPIDESLSVIGREKAQKFRMDTLMVDR